MPTRGRCRGRPQTRGAARPQQCPLSSALARWVGARTCRACSCCRGSPAAWVWATHAAHPQLPAQCKQCVRDTHCACARAQEVRPRDLKDVLRIEYRTKLLNPK